LLHTVEGESAAAVSQTAVRHGRLGFGASLGAGARAALFPGT
jgi:hypothetical protein